MTRAAPASGTATINIRNIREKQPPERKNRPLKAIFKSVGNTSAGQGSHSASAGRMTASMTVYPSGVGCTPSRVYSLRSDPSPASIAL